MNDTLRLPPKGHDIVENPNGQIIGHDCTLNKPIRESVPAPAPVAPRKAWDIAKEAEAVLDRLKAEALAAGHLDLAAFLAKTSSEVYWAAPVLDHTPVSAELRAWAV